MNIVEVETATGVSLVTYTSENDKEQHQQRSRDEAITECTKKGAPVDAEKTSTWDLWRAAKQDGLPSEEEMKERGETVIGSKEESGLLQGKAENQSVTDAKI